MREVHTELRLEHEILVKSKFGKDSREQFVFLVSQRVVSQPFKWVLARALPCTVIDGCQGSVRLVRVPIWLHETCCRNRGHQSICSFISLKNVLVVEHGVCSHLQPPGHLLLEIESHRITGELRAWSNTLLVIVSTRKVVVCSLGRSRNRHLMALKHRRVIEYYIHPVHIDA